MADKGRAAKGTGFDSGRQVMVNQASSLEKSRRGAFFGQQLRFHRQKTWLLPAALCELSRGAFSDITASAAGKGVKFVDYLAQLLR